MKRVTLLLLAMLALLCGNAFAQFHYDFDDCPAGAKVAQTLGMPWTTWNNAPGGSEDGVFAEVDGNMAAYFVYGVDQVVSLGELSTGNYNIDFDVYVEENRSGYFNLMHHYPCNDDQAVEVFIQCTYNSSSGMTTTDGHGTVNAGGQQVADVPTRWNDWMHFRVHVDLDNDVAELYLDGTLIYSWTWSLDALATQGYSDRVLGGIDFYPPQNSSRFYVDNVSFEAISNDELLIFDPFEEYTVGNHIASEALAAGHSWWTTWSNNPGSSEDGLVADFDNTQCGHLVYNNDQVLLLGDQDNGNYELEFDILVPEGKNGYFNILHHFESGNNVYAMQCYLHMTNDGSSSTPNPGHGTIHAGSNGTADVACVYDAWMHFRLSVNTDTDVAQYYYTAPGEEETLVCEWQWSKDSYGNVNVSDRRLGAMDFWPPKNAATSEFYLDNVSLRKIGGESAPHVVLDPLSIEMTMNPNDMDFLTVTINNEGNSIADWNGYIDFGQGEPGDQSASLGLHNGHSGSNIGSSGGPYLREIGCVLRPSAYAGLAMGMQIDSLKYYVGTSAQSGDGHYTFRIYENGSNNQPGELLAETTLESSAAGAWIGAALDQPVFLTGQTVWATVELLQDSARYPLSMDNGHYGEIQDGNWLSTEGGSWGHCYQENGFDGAWMITAVCSGTLVPGTWVTVDKTAGSLLGGQSEILTLIFSSINMEGGEYNANLVIHTNEVAQPTLMVPLRLNVDVDDVVAEGSARQIAVYPNPASTTLVIKGENLQYVAVYNVTGQLVGVEKLGAFENHVTLNMGSGIYFFSIYDNEGNNTVQRVVVSK